MSAATDFSACSGRVDGADGADRAGRDDGTVNGDAAMECAEVALRNARQADAFVRSTSVLSAVAAAAAARGRQRADAIAVHRPVHAAPSGIVLSDGQLAPLAVAPFGGRYLARATATAAYEAGQKERIVMSEFPSVEKAIAAYESPAYQEALKALGDGAVRDIRIVEGTD